MFYSKKTGTREGISFCGVKIHETEDECLSYVWYGWYKATKDEYIEFQKNHTAECESLSLTYHGCNHAEPRIAAKNPLNGVSIL